MRPLLWILVTLALAPAAHAQGLQPKNVFVVVNKKVPASRDVADHYCKLREVPQANVIELDLPPGENISREDFNKSLRDPLREALAAHKEQAKVLLTVYGVPLRVGGDSPSDEEKKQLDETRKARAELDEQNKQAQQEVKDLEEQFRKESAAELKQKLDDARRQQQQVAARLNGLRQREGWLSHAESVASVDSELMLLWWGDYELRKWQANVLNWQAREETRQQKPQVLMVARLDGPSPEVAKRLVDDAVAVEKKGLEGKVYVDARGIGFDGQPSGAFGYGGYDQSLRDMARLLKDEAKMPVVLDDKGPLFEPETCPEAALYCGWYSLAKYVDCCQFNRGAVAYHIASSEAVTLRNPDAKLWCPNLLKAGACATLGPVAEPYTIGFPKPAEFFGLLVTGEYTLVECYSKTMFLNSWMTVLVGDPLYNPYRANPRLRVEQVRPSPAAGGGAGQPGKSKE